MFRVRGVFCGLLHSEEIMNESESAELQSVIKRMMDAGLPEHEIIEFVATEAIKVRFSLEERPIRCKALPNSRFLLIFDSSKKRDKFIAQDPKIIFI